MENLFINAREHETTTSTCDETLTVGDLMEILSNYDEDTLIYIRNTDLTYSGFEACDIVSDFDEDKPSTFIKTLLMDFNTLYGLLYGCDTNGEESPVTEDDRKAYTEVDKKICACNWELLTDFNKARGDILTSDREVMAFTLTLKKNGLI